MPEMTDFERSILRHLAGEDVPGLGWGAAMGEAIEYLYNREYVTRRLSAGGISYEITDKGRAAIATK